MTDYASLPSSVLAKIAQLESHCLTLTTKLEASRRDLQRLRIERRDAVPQTVGDEWQANRESERVLSEWARLDAAIAAQLATCERLEQRLRAEERTVTACKRFLHELPAHARLRVVEGQAGDLDDIRARIKAVADEIGAVQRLPVPSDDLRDRVSRYVDDLAARAQPIIAGIGDGETLRVLYPLHDHADRVTLSGFATDQGNALLLVALVDGERLAERLLQAATVGSITASERNERLRVLHQQLTQLRYDEEAAITCALNDGDDVSRSGSAPAWAVLMVQVEHALEAAA